MKRTARILGFLLLPLGWLAFELALLAPGGIETWYAEGMYPGVVALFALVNRSSFSIAEILLVASLPVLLWLGSRAFRRRSMGAGVRAVASTLWIALGLFLWVFLGLWGFNYARPSLAERMDLAAGRIEAATVLDAGTRTAERAASLYRELGQSSVPTRMPFSFHELDQEIDALYLATALPGDAIDSPGAPAKPLASSTVFSYLGISGIFVPFTGEPSVNALQPDASLPVVLAHEKAHQRGITDEGEANFAAFLVCSREDAPPYLRYAAYLFATRYLLGEASRYAPEEEVRAAWALLGEGPIADVEAIRAFWERYQGRAMEAASRVNDSYLRAMHVEGGVESYGTVVQLLMALDAQHEL